MATTKTLPDGKTITMPAYNESADVQVLNTNDSNIADNIIPASGTIGTTAYTSNRTELSASVYKSAGLAHVNLAVNFGVSVPTGTAFATIPSGFRPKTDGGFPAMIQVNNDAWVGYSCTINTSGQIKQGLTSNCTGIRLTATYPC